MTPKEFQDQIWTHYKKHRRSFPWREMITPYYVVVSEIMLQQTQAPRVVPKFESFIKKFPDFKSLAKASTTELLKEWQGLGYNRRALNLQRLARNVVARGDTLPNTPEELVDLPGIGPNTAGSILAFAFDIAHPFIETNIRTVYIHAFFPRARTPIPDQKLTPLITKTLPGKPYKKGRTPRDWYYALMDYGVMLKQKHRDEKLHDPARKSKLYKKQSTFKGSNRELRAALVRSILKSPTPQHTDELIAEFITKNHKFKTAENILKNLSDLAREGFIKISQQGLVAIK